MLTTLPPPVRRTYRKRSPAQQAAIERSRERRSVRKTGGGREIANAVLGPKLTSTSTTAPESKRPKLSACSLCGKGFTSRERKRAVFEGFGLAHERCLLKKFYRYEFQPAIIACEMAIRKRLAREIQRRTQ